MGVAAALTPAEGLVKLRLLEPGGPQVRRFSPTCQEALVDSKPGLQQLTQVYHSRGLAETVCPVSPGSPQVAFSVIPSSALTLSRFSTLMDAQRMVTCVCFCALPFYASDFLLGLTDTV